MRCRSTPPFLVHCALSQNEVGRASGGAIFEQSSCGTRPRSHDTLIEGDYLAVRLPLPDEPQSVSIRLAAVTWVSGNRFGVELLIMDSDDRQRLARFLDTHFPLQMEFAEPHTEITITAAE